MLQYIICIINKELRYALRDTDVLIYSVLVPLIVYPLFIIGAGEILLWQMDSTQTYKGCLDKLQLPPYLDKELRGIKGLQLRNSIDPARDLQHGKLDLVLTGAAINDKYELSCTVANKRSLVMASKIKEALISAQQAEQTRSYKKAKVPSGILKIFETTQLRMVPTAPKQGAVEKNSPLLTVAATIIGLMQVGLVAGVTAVCMFAEEKEKKTYETTASLPIASSIITAGKWAAACLLTIGSGMLYIVSAVLSYSVILSQLLASKKVAMQEVACLIEVEPFSFLLAALTIFIGAGVSCAMCMLCVSSCKTFKDAQAVSVYPVFVITLLPALVLVPGIECSTWINFIPLTNMLVAVKHPQASLVNLFLSVIESMILITICLVAAGRVFFSEKSMFNFNDGTATQTSQQQTESV